MTSRDTMVETIRRAYDARDSGDIEALMKMYHPKGTFEFVGDKAKVQIAGLTEGLPNIRDQMSGFIATFEFQKRDFIDIVIEGERAVIHSRVQVKFVPKDTVFQTEVLDIVRFQDGKIVQIVEFADTALVKSLLEG